MTLRIANGAGFLGDNLDAPRRLVESAEVDYLTLEYLAELTLSILARLREKDPEAGYAADFITVLGDLCPALKSQPAAAHRHQCRGNEPASLRRQAAKVLAAAGLGATRIGVVEGDDVHDRLTTLQAAGCRLENLDTGQPLSELKSPVISANAYLGAQPIAQAAHGWRPDGDHRPRCRRIAHGRTGSCRLRLVVERLEPPGGSQRGWTSDRMRSPDDRRAL